MHSEQVERWQNWSGSVQAIPRQIVKPHSVDELARLIGAYGRDGRRVRVAGAGHSFTPLVQSDDVLVSLDELQGIEKIDTEHSTVTVLGGTRLKSLGEALYDHGPRCIQGGSGITGHAWCNRQGRPACGASQAYAFPKPS